MKKITAVSFTTLIILTGCLSSRNQEYRQMAVENRSHLRESMEQFKSDVTERISSQMQSYAVTYQSFPESATVVCNGVTKGMTPVVVYYPYDKESAKSGDLLTIEKCKAVWMSGATQNYTNSIVIDTKLRSSIIGAERPNNSAGLQKDMAFDQQKKQELVAQKSVQEARKLEQEKLAIEKEKQAQRDDHFYNDYSDRYPSSKAYYKDTFTVYYNGKKVEEANASSFVELRYGYAKDTFNAYYRGQKINDARGHSFEALAPNYAKDTWNVYYRDRIIKDANKSSFTVLDAGYAKDTWNVYYQGMKVEGATSSSFRVENKGYARDSFNRYYRGKKM